MTQTPAPTFYRYQINLTPKEYQLTEELRQWTGHDKSDLFRLALRFLHRRASDFRAIHPGVNMAVITDPRRGEAQWLTNYYNAAKVQMGIEFDKMREQVSQFRATVRRTAYINGETEAAIMERLLWAFAEGLPLCVADADGMPDHLVPWGRVEWLNAKPVSPPALPEDAPAPAPIETAPTAPDTFTRREVWQAFIVGAIVGVLVGAALAVLVTWLVMR